MANQITDNRTLGDAADSAGSYVASSSASLDTEVKIQSTGSIGEQITNSRRYIMYDYGSAQNFQNTVFSVWINCGIVGLLDTKANGGFAIRFGSSTSDYFEVYVGGNDEWPLAIEGGWVQFVVDIEDAHTNSDATGGTKPATNNIRYFGYSAVTAGTMTRTTDNTWMDAHWTLADGTPGIIIEGRNGGTTDWTWADVLTQIGVASGALKAGPAGTYILNTRVQWGINDTTVHGFTDTNVTILHDDQEFIPSDYYQHAALGNSGGTTRVIMGIKSGTGDDATGAQGCTFLADSAGARFDFDFNDPNLDDIGLYGCTFNHGGVFRLDDPAVSSIGSLFLDCGIGTGPGMYVSNCRDFLKNSVVDPNVNSGVAWLDTDDITDFVFNTFESNGVGHAWQITGTLVANQTDKGNTYVGYDTADPGTANNKAGYNNQGGAVAISSVSGSNLTEDFHVRNGASASTTVTANVQVTFDKIKDNTEVRVRRNSDGSSIAGIENVTAGTTDDRNFAWSTSAGTVVDYDIHHFESDGVEVFEPISVRGFTVPNNDVTIDIQQRRDLNVV